MATGGMTLSVTECPICCEDFKQQKLLPCNHSFCVDCLEGLAGGRKKVTCPECRNVADVPKRGVKAFTDNRYIEELLKLKKIHQCLKHGSPLHFFCEDCQEQICSACTTVKHKGHVAIEIEDKANSCKAYMSNTKDNVSELSSELGTHLNNLNEAVKNVRRTTFKNLNAVDEIRELLYKKINELQEKVQVKTVKQKEEILRHQEKNLEKLDKAKEETLKAISSFDEMYIDIEKAMTKMSNNEIVENKGIVEKSFREKKMDVLVDNDFGVKLNNVVFTKQEIKPEFNVVDIGKLHDDVSFIHQPEKITQAAHATMKHYNMIPNTQDIKTINTELEKWEWTKMCVSKDGLTVISGKIGDENWLKCFNTEGGRLWQIKMGKADDENHRVKGLCCVSTTNEYFFMSRYKCIELRNISNGRLICKRDVDFSFDHVCSTDDAILVKNVKTNPTKLVRFLIKSDPDLNLEQTAETINSQLKNPFGLVVVNHEGKELLIVTSWEQNTIQAIVYQTGEIVWKISGEFDGKKIKPNGICSDDIGNLYVADGTNSRVLVVSLDGKIKQRLTDTSGACCWIGRLESQRLVVNYTTDKEMLEVYDINYISS